MMDPQADLWRQTLRRRLMAVAALFLAWGIAIEARLVYLQVVQFDDLTVRAERQQRRAITLPGKRGDIVDREGRVLASNADADTVFAEPAEIRDPASTAAALCRVFTDCTAEARRALTDRLTRRKGKSWVYVRRQIAPSTARAIQALDLDGIGFVKESRRFYPNLQLAAPILGYVGLDNTGLAGIEAAYDQVVSGQAGRLQINTDARRKVFNRIERPPTTGATLELTVDEILQHIAERELRVAVTEHRAAGGTIVIMDPATGAVLAMASAPTFNPNDYQRYSETDRRNRAVQDIYEPGSTFKIVTASAALEEGVIRASDGIDCSPGFIRLGYRTVSDVHPYGLLPFTEVIVKSSNVGAIKVGFRLGADRMSRYVRRFGFGAAIARDFPGEQAGIVWKSVSDDALASMAMGYQISVTPIQMAAAVGAIANGGTLYRPYVVGAIRDERGRRTTEPEALRQAIRPDTAAALTTIMEGVVERGTAKAAQIEGYTIAGKTGTAAKLVNGAYSKSEYIASFAGFLPSRNPRVTILVMIDSPRGGDYYGGLVAAPVFKRIAEATLRHLGVPRTINPERPVMVVRRTEPPAIAPVRHTPAVGALDPDGLMPDLSGMSARDALRRLGRARMAASLEGRGVVVEQYPAPGVPVEPGSACRLVLDLAPPLLSAPPVATVIAAQP